ncbi:MAG TPA: monovalent cation/H+ antiporter subunit D family protein [Reyranella sp.]|nr:monovalent cation/H+ antiporter subunit D family protein [Reyranella sp.]
MSGLWPHLPALQVVIPLVAAILAGLVRRPAVAFALALAVSWCMPVIAGALLWQVLQSGPISYHIGGWPPPWGIEYRVDILNGFVLLLVSAVGAVLIPYARRSLAFEIDERSQAWTYCMYLLCLTGLLGITVTGDAFNAFVFLEISSLATYVLIALGHDRRALLSAFQYLIMGTVGATFYVIGVGLLYLATGTLNMADLAARLGPAWPEHSRAIVAGAAFVTVGLSLKLALFPLHLWLPGAYAYAPSWVTAFLSATATKVAIYLLVRFLYSIFGAAFDLASLQVEAIILGLSLAAMIVASLIAVFQADLKRMLAYSSVAQIGYITFGIGLVSQAGLTGGLVHLVNHALMKATLFLAAGAFFYRAHTVRIGELAGIGRRMPLTATAFTVAGFALVGTPGTVGFISKWYLVVAALERGWWPLVVAIVLSSLIGLVYGARVLEIIWLRPSPAHHKEISDPPASMLLPLLVLAGSIVYFGLETSWTAHVAERAAGMLLAGLR